MGRKKSLGHHKTIGLKNFKKLCVTLIAEQNVMVKPAVL
jgi:hypothetical protein